MMTLVLARERMTRAVMASRLPRAVSLAGRRVAAAGEWVVDVGLDKVGLAAADFVDAVLEEGLGLRAFVLVLNGFAVGARFIVVAAVTVAYDVRPAETARRRSNIEKRRSSIYCTPVGRTALFGWVEVSEMTGAGSFGWGPG